MPFFHSMPHNRRDRFQQQFHEVTDADRDSAMKARPDYFEEVRQEAARRWAQLDDDPVLAGPWHHLFRQVQSPRHVLSELLQNADDAGATDASVRIDDRTFVFEHNGEDFAEDHFRSLCRFGYSNKRVLHTIGFRGIGFKSTFSLGELVELHTPTLAVGFQRKRFTEPIWLLNGTDTSGWTRVSVEIFDHHRQEEVERNLEEWLKSPVSLLFFRNIRRIRIGDRELKWDSLEPGPVSESEWMALNGDADAPHLLVRSEDEAFPDEALEEIRQERVLEIGEDVELPPCKVEIVTGAAGGLHVVLPTGLVTDLPFACNAPFTQDPSRHRIKSPESSPTNRWLLQRIGNLAAYAMLSWLGRSDMPTEERAWAYRLLPDVDRKNTSLEGVCGTEVEEQFADEISGRAVLLTDDGNLVPEKESVAVPLRLFDVWPDRGALAKLDECERPPLCRHVDSEGRKKLHNWRLIDVIGKSDFLGRLQDGDVPKPHTWERVLKLWAYVAPDICGYRLRSEVGSFHVVPVEGQVALHPADSTIRLGVSKLLASDEEWEFLGSWLTAVDQDWLAFLSDARREASERQDARASKDLDTAYGVLEQMGLGRASDASKAIEAAAETFFSRDRMSVNECVRLAQIAAKLMARVGESFRYVTADGILRGRDDHVLCDMDGSLEELIPEALQARSLLHSGYLEEFSSCTREEWENWTSSGRSGLHCIMPLATTTKEYWSQNALEVELKVRGYADSYQCTYRNPTFCIKDWDFAEAYWKHWRRLADDDPKIWVVVFERILAQRDDFWTDKVSAAVREQASNGHSRSIIRQGVAPAWALALRQLPCLRDVYGVPRKPEDLFRRTPDTEALLDIEPFVDRGLDRETNAALLDLVGVQSTPTGPGRLLDRLRALAGATSPPIDEVEKWYRRLDAMLVACSTDDARQIREAFRTEKLIFTRDGVWETTTGVFRLSGATEVPEAEVVRSSLSDLQLWERVGVADRPTAELVIVWLDSLPVGRALDPDQVRRVSSVLSVHPHQIWNECRHWLNMAGEWVAVERLCRSHAEQQGTHWEHMHRWVLEETADLQSLPGEVAETQPFSSLPSLASQIEDRLDRHIRLNASEENSEWMTVLGRELSRAEFNSDDETRRMRAMAQRLARTVLRIAPSLEVVPYLGGDPAGTARRVDAVWLENVLYVEDLPLARQARRIPEEIGKGFGRSDVEAALHYSIGRSENDIRDYMEENFELSVPIGGEKGDSLTEVTQRPDDPETRLAGAEDAADRTSDNSVGQVQGSDSDLTAQDVDDVDGFEAGLESMPTTTALRPKREAIIDRYARAQGFRKDNDGRFSHEDGGWIARSNGARFPWERYGSDGEFIRYYLPREHCLERDPLPIDADVWRLIQTEPQMYAFILTDRRGDPIEVTGSRLKALQAEGQVVLYPATYRLVFEESRTG